MRFVICICFVISTLISACNLATPASSAIPTVSEVETIAASQTPTEIILTRTTTPPTAISNVNVGSVSPANTGTVICNKQTTWDTYTIVAGDTMFNIAQRGNTTLDILVSANCLVDASLISVGQVLYVPSPIQPPESAVNTPDPLDPNRYTVELWWIIKGDEGRTGFPVGCGDSIYLQQSGIPANLSMEETVTRAFTYLSNNNNAGTGATGRGWWNPMSQTTLTLDSYSFTGEHVTAHFSGQLNLSGVCFDAQLEPQIAINLMSLTRTKSATIYVNGKNLRDSFDMSGTNTKTTYTWDEFQYPETQPNQEQLEFWLLAETNTMSGGIQLGCEGYIVPQGLTTARTNNTVTDLTTALNTLFTPDQQYPDNLSNYLLEDQGLFVDNIAIDTNGHATIQIGGNLHGWGVCADAIFEGQIIQTIFQFDEIQSVTVMNGTMNLREFVDMSGLPDVPDHIYRR